MQQQRHAGGVTFTLTRRRVKNLNLRVRADGSVSVSAPASMPVGVIDGFVAQRAGWIARAQDRFARRRAAEAARPLPDKGEALAGMRALCEAWWPCFSGRCPGPMPAVRVCDMHTRWGSCSLRTRTVCFALRLWTMPHAAREYVVVHELCHLLHPDHSPAFWAEVGRLMPDYAARRALLRTGETP
ncbi:M48 family metallopeptidase [uncultured Gemmiger sp.]|uniref:M48 family metallopeptidase n=1 Tax=uncultured Gemmiger sp. TaxID=1623490 RepID=UPI0025F35251|nr:M48 family metallopeptidase [uncultured Gemmiger sp.]